MLFEKIRVNEFTDEELEFPSDNKFHIEFVYFKTKYGDLLHTLFGETLRVKHSMHYDDRFVYLPQNYRDFLMCLKETQTNENGEPVIDHVSMGPILTQPDKKPRTRKEKKPFCSEDDEVVTMSYLLDIAGEYLKDDSCEEEKAKSKKEKFLSDCKQILEDLKESSSESVS